ncbi:MAG: CobW family GTP-binding protein [Polyangia bacterium]
MSVGVLLIGGFLGAGKTTLVSRLLRDPHVGPRLAVLVNELGPLGLDGELIRSTSETAALRTVELDNGCLCCTLKGALGDALLELARPVSGLPPLAIIIELSGAAIASEVHFSISAMSRDDAPFHADGLVCVVDAARAPLTAAAQPDLFRDQLSRADLVLLSKLDRASDKERAASEAIIAGLAPDARVVECAFGEIDPQLLLGIAPAQAVEPAPRAHHHRALTGRTVTFAGPLDEQTLERYLEDVSPSLYRIKGIVEVTSGARVLVQCVGDQVELTEHVGADGPARLTFIGALHDVERSAAVEVLTRELGVPAVLVGTAPVGLP